MTDNEVLEFLRHNARAVLATHRRDGGVLRMTVERSGPTVQG